MATAPKIIIYDRHEIDNGGSLVIHDMTGDIYYLKDNKQELWAQIIKAQRYDVFILVYSEYKGNSFISEILPIFSTAEDRLKKLAVLNLANRVTDSRTEDKNRSVALSYALNACFNSFIRFNQVEEYANEYYRMIKGVKSEQTTVLDN